MFQILCSLFVNNKIDISIIKDENEIEMDINNVEDLMTKILI